MGEGDLSLEVNGYTSHYGSSKAMMLFFAGLSVHLYEREQQRRLATASCCLAIGNLRFLIRLFRFHSRLQLDTVDHLNHLQRLRCVVDPIDNKK